LPANRPWPRPAKARLAHIAANNFPRPRSPGLREEATLRPLAEYRKLVEAGKTTASIALEEVERIDCERAGHDEAIQRAEAVVSEWAGPPTWTPRSTTTPPSSITSRAASGRQMPSRPPAKWRAAGAGEGRAARSGSALVEMAEGGAI
jgi:hypothetical protein